MKTIYIILLLCAAGFCVNCQSPSSAHIESASDITVNPTPPDSEDGHESRRVSCDDLELGPIWELLVTDADVKELVVESERGGDCSDYLSIAKKVDLNNDGIEELFVEGNGNFGNVSTVPIWVVGREGDKFKVLLREQGEIYEIMETRTNGYSDLYFPSRRSVWSSSLSTYKFDDGKYITSKCQIAFYNNSDLPLKVFACDEKEKIEKFEAENKFE